MMSTISPVISSEPGLPTSIPSFETNNFTPYEISDLSSILNSSVNLKPVPVQDYVNPGSVIKHLNRTGLDNNSNEMRNKRRLSNRESAKRSRMKKLKHMEEMKNRLNQLKIENKELANRFRYVVYHYQQTKTENDRLRLEHHVLQVKLLTIREALMFHQIQRSSTCATWPYFNSTVVTVQQNPSVITNHVIA